ncbi:hypothetical protein Ahy_B05g078172 isoform D [Arachis hypogaea]|uniref:Uncharacterized protein n=1 Tax=Arachis hypogaea TaxID=3818 RepID=A0A444Z6F9_ARAHY|nr:hypothetical protein Ahy_B05g078172 isoform D [Arachis hypogaea]
MRYDDFVNSILQKLGLLDVKRVQKLFYRIPISVLQETVKYDCFSIGSDEDLQVLFHCRRQFPKSGGSNWNTHTIGTVADSSSRPVGTSSSVPVNEHANEPVASPSFAVDLNYSGAERLVSWIGCRLLYSVGHRLVWVMHYWMMTTTMM